MTRVMAFVPTYNRRSDLLRCVESIMLQTRPPEEFVVYDNASSPGVCEEDLPPGVELITAVSNTGGAGAYSLAIEMALSRRDIDYVWLMDDDAVADPDALARLLNTLESHESAAATVPAVEDPTGRHLASHSGGVALRGSVRLPFSSFVGPLIRVSAARRVALPVREFFIWFDDVEYMSRLSGTGPLLFVSDALIMHPAPPRPVPYHGERVRLVVRNRIWLMRVKGLGSAESKRHASRGLVKYIAMQIRASPSRRVALVNVLQGIWESLVTAPRARWVEPPISEISRLI